MEIKLKLEYCWGSKIEKGRATYKLNSVDGFELNFPTEYFFKAMLIESIKVIGDHQYSELSKRYGSVFELSEIKPKYCILKIPSGVSKKTKDLFVSVVEVYCSQHHKKFAMRTDWEEFSKSKAD
jgi:hypothetical protein